MFCLHTFYNILENSINSNEFRLLLKYHFVFKMICDHVLNNLIKNYPKFVGTTNDSESLKAKFIFKTNTKISL